MNRLEALEQAGVLEIYQTSVLPIEFNNAPLLQKHKAAVYEVLGGANWINHSELTINVGRASRFDDIYHTTFGKFWRKRGPFQNEFDAQSLRDAIHLDICWIDRVDFFLTNDKRIRQCRERLSAAGFDVFIQQPEECLAQLTTYFVGVCGTSDPVVLAEELRRLPPILLGSNACAQQSFQDVEVGETFLEVRAEGGNVAIWCKLHDSKGQPVIAFAANRAFSVERDEVGVYVRSTEARPSILLGDQRCDRFTVACQGQVYLSGRVCPSGHVLLEGQFHSANGRLVLSIDKANLRLTNAVMR